MLDIVSLLMNRYVANAKETIDILLLQDIKINN